MKTILTYGSIIAPMYITNAEPGDVPLLVRKMAVILGRDYDPNTLLHLVSIWPDGCLVVRLGGDLTGFLISVKDRPKNARVVYLGVEKRIRGQGFGTRMMKRLIKQCILEGIRFIRLEVVVDNIPAHNFYERLGFQKEGTLKGFYEDGGDAHSLVRYI